MRTDRKRRPWKGFLAGTVGGFIASIAMSQFHSLFQKGESPVRRREEDSTVKAAAAVSTTLFHHALTRRQKKIAGPAVHYAFGTAIGAIYGTAVEFAPFLRTGWGTPFGAVVWLGAHVIATPALGLSEPVTQSDPPEEAAEFGAHLVYGAVVEGLRRLVRTHLLSL
jgi:putative membrane protein